MRTSLFLIFILALATGCSDDNKGGGGDGGTGDDPADGGDSVGGGDGDGGGGGDGDGSGMGQDDDRPAVNFVPTFPGAGTSDAADPLMGGMVCDTVPGETNAAVADLTRCFFGPGGGPPAATIEQVLECVEGVQTVHLRLTFDPSFADNTYGDEAVGWTDGHTFDELVGSDHAELLLINGDGEVAMELKVDYISESDTAPSGYASGCVDEGGKVNEGDEAHVVQCMTSLDRNLNERGHDAFLESSPPTDDDYAPSMEAPDWDYRIVYEVWVDIDAFGDAGFSGAFINKVHASPSKADDNTIEVTPGECPPCMETPDYACEDTDEPPGDSSNPCHDGNPDTFCEDPGGPGDSDNPCTDGNPDTFCDSSSPPPGDEPAFCELYPTDPACKPE